MNNIYIKKNRSKSSSIYNILIIFLIKERKFDEKNKSNKNRAFDRHSDTCRKPEWESLSNDARRRVWKLTHSVNELSAV